MGAEIVIVVAAIVFIILLRVAMLFERACKRLDQIEEHLRKKRNG